MTALHRLRDDLEPADAIDGVLGAALSGAGTTITFTAAPGFATLGADQYRILRIGDELVRLTAYTAAATTGTIERAAEGTTATSHSIGDRWEHVASASDAAPVHVYIPWLMVPVAQSTWSTYSASSGLCSSDGTQNAYIDFHVDIVANATYSLALYHSADTNRGIYTVRLGGKLVATDLGGSSDTIDGYAGSTTLTRSTITGISPPAGRLVLRLTMASKHASSSSYVGALAGVGLTATAWG